jgi:hypothetical protein
MYALVSLPTSNLTFSFMWKMRSERGNGSNNDTFILFLWIWLTVWFWCSIIISFSSCFNESCKDFPTIFLSCLRLPVDWCRHAAQQTLSFYGPLPSARQTLTDASCPLNHKIWPFLILFVLAGARRHLHLVRKNADRGLRTITMTQRLK